MDFEQVWNQYIILKENYDRGFISQEEFVFAVNNLVATAPDGKLWMLDPFSASWIEVPLEQRTPDSQKLNTNEPQSLLQLFTILVKGIIINIPRTLLISGAMALVTWIAHTYLIAAVNDGLMFVAQNRTINSIVHLQQTHFPGVNAFWGLLSYFLSSFFHRAISMGPMNWLQSIKNLPENVKSSFFANRIHAQFVLISGVILSLFFMLLARNFMLSFILSLGILLILTARFASLETLVLKTTLLDLQRLIRLRVVREGEEYHSVYLLLLGMSAGFFLVGIFQARILFTFLGLLLVGGLFGYLIYQQKYKFTTMLLIIGGSALFYEMIGSAYCEGASLSQVGGSWIQWWGMQNADVVRWLGVGPAVSSLAGSVLGTIAANLSSIMGSMFKLEAFGAKAESFEYKGEATTLLVNKTVDAARNVIGRTVDAAGNVIEGTVDIAQRTFTPTNIIGIGYEVGYAGLKIAKKPLVVKIAPFYIGFRAIKGGIVSTVERGFGWNTFSGFLRGGAGGLANAADAVIPGFKGLGTKAQLASKAGLNIGGEVTHSLATDGSAAGAVRAGTIGAVQTGIGGLLDEVGAGQKLDALSDAYATGKTKALAEGALISTGSEIATALPEPVADSLTSKDTKPQQDNPS